jgi:hypothetical protein
MTELKQELRLVNKSLSTISTRLSKVEESHTKTFANHLSAPKENQTRISNVIALLLKALFRDMRKTAPKEVTQRHCWQQPSTGSDVAISEKQNNPKICGDIAASLHSELIEMQESHKLLIETSKNLKTTIEESEDKSAEIFRRVVDKIAQIEHDMTALKILVHQSDNSINSPNANTGNSLSDHTGRQNK